MNNFFLQNNGGNTGDKDDKVTKTQKTVEDAEKKSENKTDNKKLFSDEVFEEDLDTLVGDDLDKLPI